MYAGIDYGLGKSNINHETGIRYGVISSHSLGEGFYDSQEMDYGDATCPECGADAVSIPAHGEQLENGGVAIVVDMPEAYGEYKVYRSFSMYHCADYACENCEHTLSSEDCFSEEPLGWSIDDGEYKVVDCLDNDAMVLSSPYFTYAQFCSPCVPGACSLDSPMPEGAKCYCFGHEWFDGDRAPYPVFSVETGLEVLPEVQS